MGEGEDGGGKDAAKSGVEDLHKSKDSPSTLQQYSSSLLRSLQPQDNAISQLTTFRDAFFTKAKQHLKTGIEHPSEAIGIGLAAALLLMRGPRRFLFRHTLGRFQSEEAKFLKADKSVKELDATVNSMKMETKKLLERAALAESDMKHAHTDLMGAGSQIQGVAKSAYKLENQAADLMDGLREVPGREALKLRAEVASMASHLKRRRNELNKRIMKISDLGVPV